MTLSVDVKLFQNTYPEIDLSKNSFSTYIYPALQNNCKNQMCDKCSTSQDGIEKCFACRENFY